MPRATILLGLLVMLAPLPATAQGSRATKPDPEVMNYRLSMQKLRKLVDVQRALNAAHAKNPQIFDSMDGEMQAMAKKNGGPLTAAQKAALMDRNPQARSAFASAGWSSREWIVTTEAMGNAIISIETKKGTLSGPPPTTAAQIANVTLLEKNQAEYQKIMAELDQLMNELLEQ